MKGALINYNTI